MCTGEDEAVRLLLVLAGFGAAIGLAAPAQADPNGHFLAALNNAGITYHNGPDAIGSGQRACQLMGQGHPEADVIKGMATSGELCNQPPAPYYPPPFFPWVPLPGAM